MSNAARIAELRAEADRLEAIDREFKAMPPEHQLAITLHKMLCHHNHIDGCGWEYEGSDGKTDWSGHAHSHYLTKAQNIFKFCGSKGIDIESALNILRLAK